MLNPSYQGDLGELKKQFEREFSSVSLKEFMDDAFYRRMKDKLRNLPFKKEKQPLFFSRSTAKLPKELESFFNSPEVLELIAKITGNRAKKVKVKLYSFTWRDYKILHDAQKEQPGLDFIFDFTDSWDEDAGGSTFYVDGTGQYHELLRQGNTLTLVERREGMQSFLQYVNHYGNGKRVYTVLGVVL